ncbi:nucleotidyltransferase [Psychrobacillus sp. FSL K6-2836]|uniref:SMODS domain-containing nucleotidyltransferase n=1 Tax=Psychrobacillus sp. FSL K6-2836 TaxID=2921548 RepID=UPI0030F6CF73
MSTYTRVNMSTFIKDKINLDPEVTKKARSSRDFLHEQLVALPEKTTNFPKLFSNRETFNYGSFSRRTKIRPLDDIDFMLLFSANGTTYFQDGGTIKMIPPATAEELYVLRDDNGYLNSRKLLNKIRDNINKVSQYKNSDINTRKEVVTLKLISYDWTFDIVPAFKTSEESDGRSYYLIPDGNGHWQKTDPRIDQNRVTNLNKSIDYNVIEFIRIIKYCNKVHSSLKLSSYLIENLVLDYFENDEGELWLTRPYQLMGFFKYLKSAIWSAVWDPKEIQGDLNDLDLSKKYSVDSKANEFMAAVQDAIDFEDAKDYENADKKWRIVFGDEYE